MSVPSFSSLPTEVRHNIYGYLDKNDLARASRVSKEWNNECSDANLWARIARSYNDFNAQMQSLADRHYSPLGSSVIASWGNFKGFSWDVTDLITNEIIKIDLTKDPKQAVMSAPEISNLKQLHQRVENFVRNAPLGQKSRFICFFSKNPECLIHLELWPTQGSYFDTSPPTFTVSVVYNEVVTQAKPNNNLRVPPGHPAQKGLIEDQAYTTGFKASTLTEHTSGGIYKSIGVQWPDEERNAIIKTISNIVDQHRRV